MLISKHLVYLVLSPLLVAAHPATYVFSHLNQTGSFALAVRSPAYVSSSFFDCDGQRLRLDEAWNSQGLSSAVFKATLKKSRRSRDSQEVSAKVYSTDVKDNSAENEIKYMKLLSPYPQFQKLIATCKEPKTGYPVMVTYPLLMNLRELFNTGYFHNSSPAENEKRLLSIMKGMADALALLHAKGLSHRDIKLSNFMVDEKYNVVLIDLATATKEVRGKFRNTAIDPSVEENGDFNYMARDIYALGEAFLPLSQVASLEKIAAWLGQFAKYVEDEDPFAEVVPNFVLPPYWEWTYAQRVAALTDANLWHAKSAILPPWWISIIAAIAGSEKAGRPNAAWIVKALEMAEKGEVPETKTFPAWP